MKSLTKLLTSITILISTFNSVNAQAGEESLYDFLWLDPDKSVYVLQNKLYPKNFSFYVDLGYVSHVTGKFQDTSGVQLKSGYYFTEEWAIELAYQQYTSINNSAYDSVKAVNGAEPFIRSPIEMQSIFIVWSPFYGKINTFNKIYYFDWSFGIGTGAYKTTTNLESVNNASENSKFKTETHTPIQFKTNVKFHVKKNVHLGLEYQNTSFEAKSPGLNTSNKREFYNDITFTIGTSF